jgi:hypothetical protein
MPSFVPPQADQSTFIILLVFLHDISNILNLLIAMDCDHETHTFRQDERYR